MDLPKNITQIGESDQRCKVYVEDYVISYMKQMNRQAEEYNSAVALYGVRKEEDDISYVFLYGAGKIHSIQKAVRHLSQAQNQEIEKLRKSFFAQYQFLGYWMVDGEMIEGFHICEQGTCRYINGYACFYEKNDLMLAYMLDSRKEEVAPESVDQEKYERVKQRQEERRAQYRAKEEEGKRSVFTSQTVQNKQKEAESEETGKTIKKAGSSLKIMRVAVAGLFLLLCILGISGLNQSYSMEDIQAAARKLITEFTEQKLPDADTEPEMEGQVNTLVAEDKLADAIIQENMVKQETVPDQQTQPEPIPEQQPQPAPLPEQQIQPAPEPEQQPAPVPDQSAQITQESTSQTQAPVSYTIKKGDTLTAISLQVYGTDIKVKEICELNNIKNPDNIRFGQKILLP